MRRTSGTIHATSARRHSILLLVCGALSHTIHSAHEVSFAARQQGQEHGAPYDHNLHPPFDAASDPSLSIASARHGHQPVVSPACASGARACLVGGGTTGRASQHRCAFPRACARASVPSSAQGAPDAPQWRSCRHALLPNSPGAIAQWHSH